IGLSRHHVASEDPVIFIIGPNTAGASPTVPTFPINKASPLAKPAFCIPTSKEILRHDLSSKPNNLHAQYPKKYPDILCIKPATISSTPIVKRLSLPAAVMIV